MPKESIPPIEILTVRQRAIVALGRIKDPQTLPALMDIVLENMHESHDAARAVRKFGKKALPWYGEEGSLEPLTRMLHDPEETVRIAAAWAVSALQKATSYRNHFGM